MAFTDIFHFRLKRLRKHLNTWKTKWFWDFQLCAALGLFTITHFLVAYFKWPGYYFCSQNKDQVLLRFRKCCSNRETTLLGLLHCAFCTEILIHFYPHWKFLCWAFTQPSREVCEPSWGCMGRGKLSWGDWGCWRKKIRTEGQEGRRVPGWICLRRMNLVSRVKNGKCREYAKQKGN